jgi:Ni/Fe-hydrogenase subunit HybB-like protein
MTKNIFAGMIIVIAITAYSVLVWIFSLTIQPGWHSTIFGPYFVIAAVYSGTAVIIITMWLFRKIYKLETYITEKHFVKVGLLLLIGAAVFGYFTFSDYLTRWHGSTKIDSILISKLFKEYFWQFIFANYIGVLVPIFVMAIAKFRTIRNITIAAVIAVVAIWVNRYLIVVPTLETPYLPIQDSREAWFNYSISWVEISLTLSALATFCLGFMIASKIVPIISISELTSEDKKE